MENYKVMQRLGKGAQGSVFLVQHLEDKQHYVLKKVECNDETEANKAFKEAMALNELRHPYICGYREFFVTWDKEEAAMFVCIVMDYYKMGDLDRVLKQRRKHKQPLEEIIIKKWLGQMIEALVFVHKKEVIHRDLKPSNIFLKEDLSLSLGDFGVATIMGDKRTKTRTTVGSMNWMAPEVLERPYDERSDVWSLGCITLEMITCHIFDSTQMSGHLFELKNNPQLLEDVLNRVGLDEASTPSPLSPPLDKDSSSSSLPSDSAGMTNPKLYSLELCASIRTMLRRNFEQRPKATDLVDFPYVQDCLRLNVSPLAQRVVSGEANPEGGPEVAETASLTAAADSAASTTAGNRRGECDLVPTSGKVEELVAYLIEWKEDEVATSKGLVEMLRVSKTTPNFFLPSSGKRVLRQFLTHFRKRVDIPTMCCEILAAALITEDGDKFLASEEVIKAVVDVMRTHVGNQSLQLSACQLLMGLSADESACELIGRLGGIQDILAALRAFRTNVQICAACCSALWSLTVNENNAQLVTEEKGISDVVSALRAHGTKSDADAVDLVESACAALLSLSMEEENIETMRQSNSMALLVGAVQIHIGNSMVVKNATMAMASLAESDEVSALKVFKDPGEKGEEGGGGGGEVSRKSSGDDEGRSFSDSLNGGADVKSQASGSTAAPLSVEEAALQAEKDLSVIKGIPIILKAYEMHKENAEVVEGIVSLILELAEYDDLRFVLASCQLHETLLKEALEKFEDKEEVASPAQAAIDKLLED